MEQRRIEESQLEEKLHELKEYERFRKIEAKYKHRKPIHRNSTHSMSIDQSAHYPPTDYCVFPDDRCFVG